MTGGSVVRTVRRLFGGYGLRGKLLRRIGGTVLGIFIVMAVLNYMQASNSLRQQAEQTGRAQAAVAAQQINGLIQTVAARSAQMSEVVALGSLTTAQLRAYFRNLLPAIPASQAYNDYVFFEHLDYRDKDAQIFYIRPTGSQPRYLSYDYHTAAHPWYSVPAHTHRPFVSEPFFASGGSDVSMVSVVAPVLRGSDFLGVAGSDLPLAPLSQITDALRFASPGNQGANGSYAFLVSAAGNLVTFPDRSKLVGNGRPGQTIAKVDGGSFAAVAGTPRAAMIRATLPDGAPALVFTEPVPAAGWKLALVVPESLIFAPLDGLRQQAIALTIAGTAVMLVLVFLLTDRIVRPVTRVKLAAELLARGQVSVAKVLPPPSSDEVGELSVAFRLMDETLQEVARERQQMYLLEQQRARAAEQLAALRSDFVAAVNHELRTPLAAVLGYGELLQYRWDSLSDERRRASVDHIVEAANRQHKLIENLLHISRIESDAPALRREPVCLAQAATSAAANVKGNYPNQRIDLAGPQDLAALADGSHVEQILTNLLDNAAKYSPEGSPISISWELEGEAAVVRVRDAGPGIPAEGRSILFTRFGRVPGSRIRAGRVGTGLGLFLGREFTEAMGGTLDLESTGNTGSTFCLRLPACLPPVSDPVATQQ